MEVEAIPQLLRKYVKFLKLKQLTLNTKVAEVVFTIKLKKT